jgi:hypothetical protein
MLPRYIQRVLDQVEIEARHRLRSVPRGLRVTNRTDPRKGLIRKSKGYAIFFAISSIGTPSALA